jgi:putative ABC transport system permease protein
VYSAILHGSVPMFANHFKMALRSIRKHKGFAFINIAGLTVGLVCSISIAVYVRHELSFDRHHEKAHRIYRVCPQFGPGGETSIAWTAPPMAQAMLEDFPEIENAVRLDPWSDNCLVRYKEKSFLEKSVKSADPAIFDVFTIPFLLGDPKTALRDPYTIVITEETAHKYFEAENPLGQSLRFEDEGQDYQVTGVIENCPDSSHWQYDMIASLGSQRLSRSTRWMSHCYFTYVCLKQGIKPSQLEAKFPGFILRHYGPQFLADTGVPLEEHIKNKDNAYGYTLQPLLDIHLNTHINDNLSIKANPVTISVFFAISVFPYRLYKFHEPGHSPLCPSLKRDRPAQSSGFQPKAAHLAVPWRIGVHEPYRPSFFPPHCAGCDASFRKIG